MKSKITIGDLLYHSVHGMCRVKEIVRTQGSSDSYALVPQLFSRMRLRYVIPQESLKESGFRAPVTLAEAGAILNYFRTGRKLDKSVAAAKTAVKKEVKKLEAPTVPMPPKDHSTWAMAETMMTCSREEFQFKEQRMRTLLHKDATGLVRELAFVFKVSLRDAVTMIQKNLRGTSKLNPAILSALEKASEE
jgi:RNA polymerase-interacting CarD/CdnL/TRCF family regulator